MTVSLTSLYLKNMHFQYIIEAEDKKTRARAGRIITPHGEIETPIFMPVGTLGAIKTLDSSDIAGLGAQIMLSNTYHLFIRPGTALIKKAGGLHKFMHWDRPLLTDSGGYQVFSLKEKRKITEEGVGFQSHLDGTKVFFTPESVIQAEKDIGADIIMPFDECIEYPCEKDDAVKAMQRTHRWLDRCICAHRDTPTNQALFGIIQGGVFEDLRRESTTFISGSDVDGISIGGLSVGEPIEDMYRMTGIIKELIPKEKPLYLMGVGTPANLIESVSRGVDMFDCVMPTRIARHGSFFTPNGRGIIKNKEFEEDFSPLVEGCECYACKNHTKAYIRHLFRVKETTAAILMSIHNIYYLVNLMKQARQAILEDRFLDFYNEEMSLIKH